MISEKDQYIGIQNGVVLCIDEIAAYGQFRGKVYHGYRSSGIELSSYEELIHVMGRLFDDIQCPRMSIHDRSFVDRPVKMRRRRGRKEKVMTDNELLNKHGDIGTFIIRVQQRQNSTWQGRITWVEENKTIHFRSMLEMIKLIESGLASENPEMFDEEPPAWKEEE